MVSENAPINDNRSMNSDTGVFDKTTHAIVAYQQITSCTVHLQEQQHQW